MGKRLVFGDDGSDHADLAWRWIAAHSWPGWSVDVISALPPDGGTTTAPPPRVPPAEGFADSVAPQVVEGDPRVALLKASRDADLLVVGPRGRGLLKAMHLGSTSEWLIQAPPVPLVIARSDRPTARVVVAADGSVHSHAAAAAVAALPWSGQLEVLVVTVGDQREGTAIADAAGTGEPDRAGGRRRPCGGGAGHRHHPDPAAGAGGGLGPDPLTPGHGECVQL